VSAARGICLRALTGAPKTRSQLADLLAARDIPDDAAETVLDRFTEVGLIDDAAFARAWVSSRQAGRGLARRALSAELRAKGVDAEVAATAVEAVDDDDERETARRLVARKVGAMRRLDRPTATRRLMGMLARKGYSGGLAAAVVREALDAADSADAEVDAEFDALDEDALLP
jgi:regulatory protein